MIGREIRSSMRVCGRCAALVGLLTVCHAASPPKRACERVTIESEVSADREWKATLGQGWVFRVLPINATKSDYSGWDLVVDREPLAGYPDALLLATLPYNSINEREIGTTFGLRAQDAIGWNPRSFRFLSTPAELTDARRSFLELSQSGFGQGLNGKADTSKQGAETMARLLKLEQGASRGELRILDAHIVPGVADPMPFAQAWALAAAQTPHEIEAAPAKQASQRGKLLWMRFRLTLWLPAQWNAPRELHATRFPCPE